MARVRRRVSWVSLLSLGCLGLLVYPWFVSAHPYAAISFQLRAGEGHAWALFALMAVLLGSFSLTLARRGRQGSAFLFSLTLPVLVFISCTDPQSLFHLVCFLTIAISGVWWLVAMAADLDDNRLYSLAVVAFFALLCAGVAMGLGERLLIGCVIGGLNVVEGVVNRS